MRSIRLAHLTGPRIGAMRSLALATISANGTAALSYSKPLGSSYMLGSRVPNPPLRMPRASPTFVAKRLTVLSLSTNWKALVEERQPQVSSTNAEHASR
jgi:hypothetical protein